MKKLLAIAMLSGIFMKAKSQVYVQGGVNLANITKTASGETQDNNILTTFNAGILGRFGLSTPVDLESGVLVVGRGSKADTYFSSSTDNNYVKTKFNPLYFEVPLNVVLRFPFSKDANLFFNGGPYAEIGFAGKSKTETNALGATSTSTDKIEFSNDNPFTSQQDDASYSKLKRFGFGLNLGGGFDLGSVILKVNYEYGLTKINSTQGNNSADNKNKYRTLSFSLGIPLSSR